MRTVLLSLCALLGVWALAVQGQELAGGWSKAHADLRNSNVHPTTGAIRSLDNTEYVEVSGADWGNGGVAHDQEGNSYFPALNTLYQLNKEGNWTSGPLLTEFQYGHPAVPDNDKVVVLSRNSVDVFDLASQSSISTSWVPQKGNNFLGGPSAVVVDGLIYVLNSDGEMMVFDFDLQLQALNNASQYVIGENFTQDVSFCTPATDGQGNFYFFTDAYETGMVFAIRFPENELLWYHTMAELDPFPELSPYCFTHGSPSLSKEGDRLFMPVGCYKEPLSSGGVVALDTSNGDLVWATAITDLEPGDYHAENLVPTMSPVDGSIITHWLEFSNWQNNSLSMVVVGLDAETGEKVHFLELLPGVVGTSPSPGAVTADGVYYLSMAGAIVAVDLESFEMLWYRNESSVVSLQSISIAADGSVYFPRGGDGLAVLRCKEDFALDGSGTCRESCAHANARFIGRNLCGYDCGEEVAVLFPLEEPGCGACHENQFWSSEELACEECPQGTSSPAGSMGASACVEDPASSSSEDGDGSGSTRLQSSVLSL
ncbi:hypothetical protein QOT17_004068 [Balamuthia mandrillaris]